MRIGIDLDGVVFDSETLFRTYEEIFDIYEVGGNNLINREEPKFQQRYNWNQDKSNQFINIYYDKVTDENTIMPGFLPVYELLKQMGHELIVVTARGITVEAAKTHAIEMFEKYNLKFDEYFWAIKDKTKVCKEQNIDVMIDDDWRVIEDLVKSNIKALYFRDTNLKKLEENEYLKEVNNWGDILRYFVNNKE